MSVDPERMALIALREALKHLPLAEVNFYLQADNRLLKIRDVGSSASGVRDNGRITVLLESYEQ